MTETIQKLQLLLNTGADYFSSTPEEILSKKSAPEKWSKKEILGHLIDSAINNLQRFTEIQFEPQPYTLKKYNQNGLVTANDYQNADSNELLNFWIALNNRIINVIELQTETTLEYKIHLDKTIVDLQFLITDYVVHLEHHLQQITN